MFRRGVGVDCGKRQRDDAVRKRGDFHLADHQPVKAGCLCGGERRLSEGEGGCNEGGGDDGAGGAFEK
ncbi:hypothetical protein D3C86_1801900 [compost metagenome]